MQVMVTLYLIPSLFVISPKDPEARGCPWLDSSEGVREAVSAVGEHPGLPGRISELEEPETS